MNSIVFAGTVIFIIGLNIILGFYRRRTDKEEFTILTYAADPNKNKFSVITLSLLGTIVGGGMFLAIGQIGFETRYVGLILGLIYILGLGLAGFLSPKIRALMEESGSYTLIDFLSIKYDGRTVIQFSLINFLMYLFLLASQFVAMYEFFHFVEDKIETLWVPYFLIILAIIALFIYPIIGGIKKDIQTDIIQIVVIFIASLLISYQLISEDVLNKVYSSNLFEAPDKTEYGLIFIIGAIVFVTPSFFVRMDIWQRINTAKTSNDSKYGFIIAGFASFLFFSIFTIIGSYANIIGFEGSKFATLNTISYLFESPLLLGFIIGGFFAAVLSSADTLINNVSLFATKLFFPKSNFSKLQTSQDESEINLLKKSRYSAVILTFFALILSLIVPDIVELLIGAFSLLLIFLPTIIGLLNNHKSQGAAFYSSLISFIIFMVLFFFWNPTMAFIPAVLTSFIVYFPYHFFEKRQRDQTISLK